MTLPFDSLTKMTAFLHFFQPKSEGEVNVELNRIVVYPKYNVVTMEFDFAILKVKVLISPSF